MEIAKKVREERRERKKRERYGFIRVLGSFFGEKREARIVRESKSKK